MNAYPYAVPDQKLEPARVAWVLIGGRCAGTYHAESSWPPPKRIRAVYGGELPAVLDRLVVEYELASHGFVCRGLGAFASYFPAGWTTEQRARAARRAISNLSVAPEPKGAPVA